MRIDINARLEMFVVRPENDLPVIYEVGKEKRTLDELGIGHNTDVVIFDVEITQDKVMSNKSELYRIIASHFNIEKTEYEALLPKPLDCPKDVTQVNFFDHTASVSNP